MKHLLATALVAVLLIPLPAMAGDLCSNPAPGTPNDSHIRVHNATADAGVWVTAYSYAIAGRKNSGAWCVGPNHTDTHGLKTTVTAVRFEITQPNCAHPVRLDREVRAGDAIRSGTITCRATVEGDRARYNILSGE